MPSFSAVSGTFDEPTCNISTELTKYLRPQNWRGKSLMLGGRIGF